MTEHEQRQVDNFMKEFKNLLRQYNAVYKSTGFHSTAHPQIMFRGVPDDKGRFFLSACIFSLPDIITPE